MCKRWRSLSLQSWSSIHDIDFSNADVTGQAFTDISTDKVINILQKVKGHVQSLILGGNQGWLISQDFPKIISEFCELKFSVLFFPIFTFPKTSKNGVIGKYSRLRRFIIKNPLLTYWYPLSCSYSMIDNELDVM